MWYVLCNPSKWKWRTCRCNFISFTKIFPNDENFFNFIFPGSQCRMTSQSMVYNSGMERSHTEIRTSNMSPCKDKNLLATLFITQKIVTEDFGSIPGECSRWMFQVILRIIKSKHFFQYSAELTASSLITLVIINFHWQPSINILNAVSSALQTLFMPMNHSYLGVQLFNGKCLF